MGRIRTIKPEFYTSETLAQLSLQAERSFAGLLTQADDKGRLRDQPAVLNGALWPLRSDHSADDMKTDIEEILALGLLCRYTGPDGKTYLHFPTWNEHQKISHPSTRNLAPECPVHDLGGAPLPAEPDPNVLSESEVSSNSLELSGNFPEPSGKTRQGKEGKGKELVKKPTLSSVGGVGGVEQPPPAASAAVADATVNSTTTNTRAKKSTKNTTTTDREPTDDSEADQMGVYDTPVPPFTDLREQGAVKRGGKKVGKNGVTPELLPDVEKVILHFVDARKRLGVTPRVTDTWWTDTQSLLRGTETRPALTADQTCDLIDFATQNGFWHSLVTDPKALTKHGMKLFTSDDYVSWSLGNRRPEANRPRNHLIRDRGHGTGSGTGSGSPLAAPKGQIAADRRWTSDTPRDAL